MLGELCRLPIAQSLRLRNTFAQHDSRQLAQALLLDAPLRSDGLQVDETCCTNVSQLVERTDIARNIGTYFLDVGIFEQALQLSSESHSAQTEQIATLWG